MYIHVHSFKPPPSLQHAGLYPIPTGFPPGNTNEWNPAILYTTYFDAVRKGEAGKKQKCTNEGILHTNAPFKF
jgi:hypothetical protein